MAAELGDLYDVQVELLEAAVASLDHIPDVDPTLEGAPERQFVAPPGDVALDCSQVLVVSRPVGEMTTGPSGAPGTAGKKHVYGRINQPGISVIVARCCIPTGELSGKTYIPPTAAAQQEAARQLLADGWALWNGIFSRLVEGEILDRCTAVSWDTMVPLGPSGACGGWELHLRVRLAGYLEELGS